MTEPRHCPVRTGEPPEHVRPPGGDGSRPLRPGAIACRPAHAGARVGAAGRLAAAASQRRRRRAVLHPWLHAAAAALLLVAGCAAPPVLQPAQPGALRACADLAAQFRHPLLAPGLTASAVGAGPLAPGGVVLPAHCLVAGRLAERRSAVDGQTYAIGFQMRLPDDWNGRFFHQGNGGLDGIVQPAVGLVGGGGETSNALAQGFAVLSSDTGHDVRQLPLFGLDPQARLDYGWQAVATLTPVAKALIAAAYGRGPDRSYFGGCSNGGRHAMVAAARHAADYDGFLAGNPGFNLPRSAVAQLWGAQQYARLVAGGDLAGAYTPAERQWLAGRILARCDALDGAADGSVADMAACQRAFDVERDVPACGGDGARDGRCLSTAQKAVLRQVFAGAVDSRGRAVYAPFPFDPGIAGADWASWKFVSSVTNRDPVAWAYVFRTPPLDAAAAADPRVIALQADIDAAAASIDATDARYTESAMQFMTPPGDMAAMRRRGGKLLLYHGVADGVFSAADTAAWAAGQPRDAVRLFLVPGMNHCRGGPATDQFDMLKPLVAWVERGQAPERVIARARGAGSAVPNPEVPPAWAPDRTRPLCPHPLVARYNGSGDIERADNFSCKP